VRSPSALRAGISLVSRVCNSTHTRVPRRARPPRMGECGFLFLVGVYVQASCVIPGMLELWLRR
jgi:hypothetical protein